MLVSILVYLCCGAVAGVLAGLLGVGGGIVIVPMMVAVFPSQGIPAEYVQQIALGTSLASTMITSISSSRAHHKRGAVHWDIFRNITPGILLGTFLGGLVATHMPTLFLKVFFICFLGFVSLQMLSNYRPPASREMPGALGTAGVGGVIGLISSFVGIGGGNALDTAKAVANLLTNPGKAEDYQGWELVKNPAVYKIGIPTLSGTGSECSRTCVLTNIPKNLKLGMNSDYTVYDQLLLDPDLLATVPRDQYFYTGIDTFMHCVESLQGSYRNAIIDAFSVRAVQLCEEIFLSDDMMSEENREKMMIASYIGGMAAGNVGVIHPFSAGLGVVLHVAHGLGNCLALNVLGDIYPKEYKQFRTMIERQGVNLPTGICKDLTEEQYEGLYRGCIVHEKPLTNALGPDFKQILTRENLIERYKSI